MEPPRIRSRHIERQIAYARPIVILLALIALFQQTSYTHAHRSFSLLVAYFVLSIFAVLFERPLGGLTWHLPLALRSPALACSCTSARPPCHMVSLSFLPATPRVSAGDACGVSISGGLALVLVMLNRRQGRRPLDARVRMGGTGRRNRGGRRGMAFLAT